MKEKFGLLILTQVTPEPDMKQKLMEKEGSSYGNDLTENGLVFSLLSLK